jgi:hypothetical protein
MIAPLRRALSRLRSFFRKEPLDQELKDEMASHIELAMEENIRKGMPEEEARRNAMVRFGGVQQAKEQHRETRGLPWMDVLGQDLRFTFRTLAKDRGFTMIAIQILGLGIGANVAVSGFAGNLWGHLVFRHTADTGNRHSHGAGRNAVEGGTRRDWQNAGTGGDRDSGGRSAFVCAGQRHCFAALWDGAYRSAYVRGDGGAAGRCSSACRIPAGAPSLAHRSDECVADELTVGVSWSPTLSQTTRQDGAPGFVLQQY